MEGCEAVILHLQPFRMQFKAGAEVQAVSHVM